MRTARTAGRAPLAALLALVVLVTALAGSATAQSPEERRLAQTRAKIEQVKAQIGAAEQRREGAAAALAEAQRHLAVVMEAVGEAQMAVDRQRQQVENARAELESLESQAVAQREAMRDRAVSLYMQSGTDPLTAWLGAESPEEVLRRSAYQQVVTRGDREQLEQVTVSQTAVDAQRRYLEAEEATLERVLEQERAVLAEAEALRSQRALVLAASTQEVQQLEAQERHLEAESRQIAAIARRPARPASRSSSAPPGEATGDAAPARGAGGWVWPASGPVTSGYGPRWGRMHEGIDIGAPTGAPIVAARAGTVSYAGSMSGYGNLVLLDHGGGIVTAYAHQSRIGVSVGQSVGAGQRIGSIGCTGHCTGPHLHFEVRVNGSPRNPRNYLG